jgi:Flp pilus assembly pilin Flp
MLATRLAEARSRDRERGASVVEWVVITTIVVVIAVTVGVLITNALTTKGNDIQNCINDAGTTTTCTSGG